MHKSTNIKNADSIDNRIKNVLDPSRELEFNKIREGVYNVKTKDKTKNEIREYFVECDSTGSPINCTCKAGKYYNTCRHQDGIRVIKNKLAVPESVKRYKTNGIENETI